MDKTSDAAAGEGCLAAGGYCHTNRALLLLRRSASKHYTLFLRWWRKIPDALLDKEEVANFEVYLVFAPIIREPKP